MRTNPWLEKSKLNLIPLSLADEFIEALKEWTFTGEVQDYGDATEDCELCEHPELRYHFEIQNEIKKSSLWVGSSCILRFQEIGVFDEDGNRLIDKSSRSKELNRMLKKALEDKMLAPLRKLWKARDRNSDERLFIERAVRNYKLQSAFTPIELLNLFKFLDSSNISYDPKNYKISLRSDDNKYSIYSMSNDDLQLIRPCFTNEQMKKHTALISKNSC
ncbi:hypothetical protein H5183_15745 [Pseudoalteromonas sp. SR44-8]|uniref:hypothetical protein n=1 Tax=Pseudoalteromonas sp. SR44-8 TaxID=2760933 RepID=UPI0016011E3A|nr:hypothetical protein [Pseudoalteromonas sp. SR44-8]MBB1302798.1 hypothetical protein [Pseudoalteromonas sp. SR44-8]